MHTHISTLVLVHIIIPHPKQNTHIRIHVGIQMHFFRIYLNYINDFVKHWFIYVKLNLNVQIYLLYVYVVHTNIYVACWLQFFLYFVEMKIWKPVLFREQLIEENVSRKENLKWYIYIIFSPCIAYLMLCI